MLKVEKFIRKSFPVDVIQITDANLVEVAAWCGGEVQQTKPTTPGKKPVKFIRVEVLRPLNDRQTKGFVGDRILQVGTSYKIYTEKAFLESFEAVEKPTSIFDSNLVPAGTDRFA
jgi:hypothetical protein